MVQSKVFSFLGGVFIWFFVSRCCLHQSRDLTRKSFRYLSTFLLIARTTTTRTERFSLSRTKGLSLEEMDKVFGDSVGTAIADRERQARIHKSLGLDAYGQSDVESGGRSSDEKDIKA
jgi:hypothetical protein